MNNTAVFAGSFDPFTLGHFEVARLAAEQFGRVIIAVADTPGKRYMFTGRERAEIARLSTASLNGVEVVTFAGLLTDFMKSAGAKYFVRGLRSSADLEYERALMGVYRVQLPGIVGCYYLASPETEHISSSLVRELVSLGGDPGPMICKEAAGIIMREQT